MTDTAAIRICFIDILAQPGNYSHPETNSSTAAPRQGSMTSPTLSACGGHLDHPITPGWRMPGRRTTLRTIIAALAVTAALSGCGAEETGPAAKAFNEERRQADALAATARSTRIMKPPRAANGGYGAAPGTINSRGEIPQTGADDAGTHPADAPVDAKPSQGYLLQKASKEPPAPDPAREVALRRVDAARASLVRAEITDAERRRKAIIAAQRKSTDGARQDRVAAMKKRDAQMLKRYRPPRAVQASPPKGTASSTTGRPTPQPGVQTPTPRRQ